MEKRNKEIMAVSAGLLLILAVLSMTFLRPVLFPEKKTFEKKPQEQKASYKLIYPKNLQGKMASGEKFQLIDIRPFEEYAKEHLIDSENITPESIISYGGNIERNPVIISDVFDYGFLEAVSLDLKKKGADSPLVLYGGIEEWKNMNGSTVTYGNPEAFSDQSKVSYISQEDFKKIIQTNQGPFVIDVRSAEEFAKSHIPGAVNIPLYELERRRDEIPVSKIVVIYSGLEIEAFQAAVRLYDTNFATSSVLIGGFSKWVEGGEETVK